MSDYLKKQAIVVCHVLLQRSMAITTPILASEILSMCHIMKIHPSKQHPLVVKARIFLAEACTKFSDNGLFVLLFKLDISEDGQLNEYLQTLFMLFNQKSTATQELPMRDITQKMFMFKDITVDEINNVLQNLSCYVMQVKPSLTRKGLLPDLLKFLNTFTTHTYTWKTKD